MQYSKANLGRIFVLRLEDGDTVPGTIESFAEKERVLRAMCILVGGARDGSRLVVGPEDSDSMPPLPVTIPLDGVHEIAAVGTIFPDDDGLPRLHMHAACGRYGETKTGCVRPGVDIWKIGEVVLLELTDTTARRRMDPETGFSLLST